MVSLTSKWNEQPLEGKNPGDKEAFRELDKRSSVSRLGIEASLYADRTPMPCSCVPFVDQGLGSFLAKAQRFDRALENYDIKARTIASSTDELAS